MFWVFFLALNWRLVFDFNLAAVAWPSRSQVARYLLEETKEEAEDAALSWCAGQDRATSRTSEWSDQYAPQWEVGWGGNWSKLKFSFPSLFLTKYLKNRSSNNYWWLIWIKISWRGLFSPLSLLQPQLISPLCQEFRRAGGPRIKHVCRAASVVLGQPRALVPDDIPRLSALPLHERSGISPSALSQGCYHNDLYIYLDFCHECMSTGLPLLLLLISKQVLFRCQQEHIEKQVLMVSTRTVAN